MILKKCIGGVRPILCPGFREQLTRRLRSPWVMWSVACCFVVFQFLLQMSAGAMVGQLANTFHITAFGAGLLAASFYFIYVLLQTPAGMLVDWWGPRRLLAGGGVACAAGCWLFAISPNFTVAIIGRLIMGMGASFAFVSMLHLIAEWFPARRFGAMVGLVDTVGMLGTLLGTIYLANMLEHAQWRHAMHILALVALVLGCLCWLIILDRDEDASPVTVTSINSFSRDVIWIIRHPGMWFNGLYTGLLFSVATVFAALWAVPYLVLAQKIPTYMATFEGSLIFVGFAVGAPIMGWLYNKITNRNMFLSGTAILAAIVVSVVIYLTPKHIWPTAVLFLTLGILCSSYIFNYALANDKVPKHVRSTSIGFTNMLCAITAPLMQPIIGWVLHHLTIQHTLQGQEIYSLSNYHWALAIIPLGLLCAAGVALVLPKEESPIMASNKLI